MVGYCLKSPKRHLKETLSDKDWAVSDCLKSPKRDLKETLSDRN